MKTLLIFVLLGGFASKSNAIIKFQVSGASNFISSEGAFSVYYSNITDQTDPSGNYYVWNKTSGGPCSPSLNPNCIMSSSQMVISASSDVETSGKPEFWILANKNDGAPWANTSIAMYNVVTHFSYEPVSRNRQNRSLTKPITATSHVIPFSTFCSNLTQFGIDANCNPTDVSTGVYSPIPITLYIVADANGNGFIDPGEEILAFTFVVDSTIPKYSSPKDDEGILGFKMAGEKKSIVIRSVNLGSKWPIGNNGTVGAQFLRFYYTYGDIGSSYNPNFFATLDPTKDPLMKYYDVGVNIDGSLMRDTFAPVYSGAPYYFRAAIVDMAGNVGFLTVNDSLDHFAVPK